MFAHRDSARDDVRDYRVYNVLSLSQAEKADNAACDSHAPSKRRPILRRCLQSIRLGPNR
jgi:hypothetical protein